MITVTDDNFEEALVAVARDLQAGNAASFDAYALTPERKQEFLYALNDFFAGKLEGVAHTPQGDIDLSALLAATMATEALAQAEAEAEAEADNANVAKAFDGDIALLLVIEHAKVRAGLAAADEFAPAEIAEDVKGHLLLEALATTAKKSAAHTVKAAEVAEAFARVREAKANFKEFKADFNRALDATEAADKARQEEQSNAFAPIRGCGDGWSGPTPAPSPWAAGVPISSPVNGETTLGVAEPDVDATSVLDNERACQNILDKLGADYRHEAGFAALGRAEDAAEKGENENSKTALRTIYHVANNLKLRLREIEFPTAQEEFGFVLAIDEVTALLEKLT